MHSNFTYRWLLAACFWLAASCAWAGPVEDQYAVATGHYGAGRWRLASDEFDAFLTQFPGHPLAEQVRFLSGEALMQQGRYEEARRRFAAFLESQPDHKYAPEARFRLGETAYFLGDADAARVALELFRENHPTHKLNQNALSYLGDLALGQGDPAAAQAFFTKALENFPETANPEEFGVRRACRFGLARALEAMGDAAGAERFYRFVAAETQSELAGDAQLRLGLLLFHARRYEQAAREFRRLEAAFPQSERLPHARYWLARSLLAMQDWEGALAALGQANAPPDDELAPAVAFSTGDALARLGRIAEAHARLSDVVRQWPQSPWADDALQMRIDLALAADDPEAIDALASDFQRRFSQSELLPAVRLAQGRSLLRREKYTEAAAIFEQLVGQADPAASEPRTKHRTDLHRYYLGLARLGGDEFEAALEAWRPIDLESAHPELANGVRVARAASLIGLERLEEAVPLLRAYLRSQPRGPDAAKCRTQLVVSLTQLGRLGEAAEAHAELAQRNPDHPHFLPATEFLAETAYAADEKDLARRMFAILAREGNPPEYAAKGLAGLAWLESEGSDPAQAAAALERLLREHPDSRQTAEAALMQAKTLERQGELQGAAELYRLVLDKHASSDLTPRALFALAQLRDRQGQDAEAAALYERLVQEHPHSPELDAALYQWAWVLVDLNRPEEADAAFARLADEHRQSQYWPDAAYRLAERAVQAKDYRRAAELVEEILAAEPSGDVLPHAMYLQGQVAALEERWADVAPAMDRLLERFPQTPLKPAAMYWAAEGCYRRHQFEEAGGRLAELAPLVDQGDEPWLAMIPLRQAQVLAHQKQWTEAYELAASIAPRWPAFRQQYEADYLMGRCRMAEAKFGEARDYFERVIRSTTGGRSETAAMAQWMIGETYFHQKNYLEAIKAYHRVERLFPYPRWRAGALLQAGKCREARGEFPDAVKLYAQLLKDHPDSPFAEEASQRLRVAQKRTALRE